MPKKLNDVPLLTAAEVLSRHELVLLDAYGVLVHSTGAIPHAAQFIEALQRLGKPYFVLTNDAARLPSTCASFYASHGIHIPEDRIITAGSLLSPRLTVLHQPKVCVVGPADSLAYAEQAGARIVGEDEASPLLDAVLVCNTVPDLLPAAERALNRCFRSIDGGQVPLLLAPNPDVLFPKGDGNFGVTTGGLVALMEAALQARYPQLGLRFERLGKPYAPIFEAALARSPSKDMVLFGDQLETDVRGACDFGIASALMGTGVARIDADTPCEHACPTYRLRDLSI